MKSGCTRTAGALLITAGLFYLFCLPLGAQNAKPGATWTPPKTPWGHPDIGDLHKQGRDEHAA